MLSPLIPLTLTVAIATLSHADTVVIPTSSFDSYADLETYWNYLYPWGSDHNGSARMVGNSTDHSHISVANGVLTLTATPTSGQGTSSESPHLTIDYFSGTIYAKDDITVDGTDVVGYVVEGEFIAPTAVGTWPAFWLTAVNSWPPEADIGEWKGTQQTWFNTFNTSSEVKSTIVAWPDDGEFHSVKAVLSSIEGDSSDVTIDYYLDNVLQATHVGADFLGAPLYLIIDLQMEGSSGSPGPTGTTTYQIRNVQVTKVTS
ncbi:hypothetical protein PUNSTDRAFT_109359 [Punctularia strigosozonata HHB-11173 SS5]|uniref:GH16 domain-containing protein n=1 Tax=Punctularia strigosozonata (strain HHB-11173) TaxID=741275 RepID=R7RZP9_PUNST|nr:uncharacterized protein PUNSTDRAFT_109359 [Punctularia strigosozonata HHB-11173 SS5]EIN03590.1 hypothetical protein PUNSTDRAFT_109359 [Punctularia strigosozonata HHB-11173 SS5]